MPPVYCLLYLVHFCTTLIFAPFYLQLGATRPLPSRPSPLRRAHSAPQPDSPSDSLQLPTAAADEGGPSWEPAVSSWGDMVATGSWSPDATYVLNDVPDGEIDETPLEHRLHHHL